MAYKKHKRYRLFGYDYSKDGAYFITIVTKNREPLFGEIIDNEMQLSEIGEFIETNFQSIATKVSYLRVDEWVIMPNHLHLIIIINKATDYEKTQDIDLTSGLHPLVKQSVSSFVNHLKGTVKRWCNENGKSYFAWQARFHDRIIRNETEYNLIANYIRQNVENWANDNENL